jgi:hypothetical protein
MLELTAELGQTERFALVEEPRVTRNEGRLPLHLDGWIEISQPAVIPLTEALIGDDKELAAFWAAEKNKYRYDYVALACSFGPAADQPFTRAWVEVGLTSGGAGEKPIAWSMAPREVIDATKVTQTGKIGAKLEFLSGEVQEQTERQAKEWFLRAFRERTGQPYWEFRHTVQSPIAGSWQLHLVVRSPTGSVGEGRMTLRAVVARRTFLIFRKDQSFGEPASVVFTLPPEA